MHAQTRPQANDDSLAARAAAAGIFLTGGNQLRLASTIGGTRLAQVVLAAHEAGATMAGTSAGATP
ncbi:MAG: Type 1 glutamine amidotransferase-like domain-containing protein [Candidatus Limnocylindrales bacterium]